MVKRSRRFWRHVVCMCLRTFTPVVLSPYSWVEKRPPPTFPSSLLLSTSEMPGSGCQELAAELAPYERDLSLSFLRNREIEPVPT